MHNKKAHGRQGRRLAVLLVAAFLSILPVLLASPAQAHGGEGSIEGYALVQQALGHLAHDSAGEGVMQALEKVDDVLAAQDQDGVDVSQVEQARAAIMAGDISGGRALLQGSITEALAELAPAVGEETGTTAILAELPGRADLTGNDVLFLSISILLLAAGALLAWRFRPADTVGELQHTLAATPTDAPGTAAGSTSAEDAS